MTVYNALSYATASAYIFVEEPITKVTLMSDSPVRYPSNVINFDLTVDCLSAATAVTYDIAYGDGLIGVCRSWNECISKSNKCSMYNLNTYNLLSFTLEDFEEIKCSRRSLLFNN